MPRHYPTTQAPERPTQDMDPSLLARLLVEATPVELAIATEVSAQKYLRIDVTTRSIPVILSRDLETPRPARVLGTTVDRPKRNWYRRITGLLRVGK